MKKSLRLLGLFCLFSLLPLAAAAEPATLVRATALKDAPATDAQTIAELAENTAVETLERRGGWTRVRAADGEGWVKLLSLRFGAGKVGDLGLRQLYNATRTGSSGTQVTTGVRGLEAEQIATAQPNHAELKRMQGFAATREGAQAFAAEGKLEVRPVEAPQ